MINVGIYVFDGVEILDFAGPYSAFTSANKLYEGEKFNVILFSKDNEQIMTQNGITVQTNCCLDNIIALDILVIPGGREARNDKAHEEICEYIIKYHNKFRYLLSVCTGALILAKTGLLHGKNVITHKNAFTLLKSIDHSVTISNSSNIIVDGNIIMTAGVLTGIEGALKIIEEVYGNEAMQKVKDNLYYQHIDSPSSSGPGGEDL